MSYKEYYLTGFNHPKKLRSCSPYSSMTHFPTEHGSRVSSSSLKEQQTLVVSLFSHCWVIVQRVFIFWNGTAMCRSTLHLYIMSPVLGSCCLCISFERLGLYMIRTPRWTPIQPADHRGGTRNAECQETLSTHLKTKTFLEKSYWGYLE